MRVSYSRGRGSIPRRGFAVPLRSVLRGPSVTLEQAHLADLLADDAHASRNLERLTNEIIDLGGYLRRRHVASRTTGAWRRVNRWSDAYESAHRSPARGSGKAIRTSERISFVCRTLSGGPGKQPMPAAETRETRVRHRHKNRDDARHLRHT